MKTWLPAWSLSRHAEPAPSLLPIVDRLVVSCERHGHDIGTLLTAISAFDIREANVDLARRAVSRHLVEHGVADDTSERLAAGWVKTGDFLLQYEQLSQADLVVGNPPYVRLEDVPRGLTDAYRRALGTMRGRSDLYVGFFEAGLKLLKPGAVLGFICSDRWMRNQYGAALRHLISSQYAVDTVITMHDVDAFENPVSAYPAVVVLRRGKQRSVDLIETGAEFDKSDGEAVRAWVGREAPTLSREHARGARLTKRFSGKASWPGGNPVRQALVADLEQRFPPLEDLETGTRVGIGVATGCDNVYITADADLVEPERLLPLLLARDTASGSADWSGNYLVNPWLGDDLVDLDHYPRLQAYFAEHASRLKGRYVAKRRPRFWYRTIDKVAPTLLARPKLLVPDIKATAHPVLDDGECYPHHNLYFVVSDAWDLEVLGGILLSDVANAVIGSYCVKMRGGYYRFQAQYLRRMRVPDPRTVDRPTRLGLAAAFRARDREAATALTAQIFAIDVSTVTAALQS